MSRQELEIKIRPGYTEDELKSHIAGKITHSSFHYYILNKSLDARNKGNIHWLIKVAVKPGNDEYKPSAPAPLMPFRKREQTIVIAGGGPAGFFAAWALQQAGYKTIIIERGKEVDRRAGDIRGFEKNGVFHNDSNYPFGEGGAGTFSDGKLTSRSKHISRERNYILQTYVQAGAPEEIEWLAHPHIGSDHLKKVVKNLRTKYMSAGGEIFFETTALGFQRKNKRVVSCVCTDREIPCDVLVFATGHSATDSYRMLMNNGVTFRTKNFAIGFRAEHRQEIINKSQWGVDALPGVKAAEYRLTSNTQEKPVYTFCMCPGGIVVPAAAFAGTSIVNGMSYYARNGHYANAACVAGIHPDELAGKKVNAAEAIEILEQKEKEFYSLNQSYAVPFMRISDFLSGRMTNEQQQTSYPLGIFPYDLRTTLPESTIKALQAGLRDFCRKIKGYDSGILLGLESKTSSPVQVLRGPGGLCEGFDNLYMAGEGSGYAGGIISSAADGIKTAMAIAETL